VDDEKKSSASLSIALNVITFQRTWRIPPPTTGLCLSDRGLLSSEWRAVAGVSGLMRDEADCGQHRQRRSGNMEIKQSTIEEIVETEKQLILNADARYGKYSHHAKECSVFLSRSIVAVDHSHHDTFGRLFALLKKHNMLALFSALR
jgi:hypothetical protein